VANTKSEHVHIMISDENTKLILSGIAKLEARVVELEGMILALGDVCPKVAGLRGKIDL